MRYQEFTPEPIYYFSYGMLTNPLNMHQAELIGPAILPNFKFELSKYANVVYSLGDHVEGVLWKLDRSFLGKLDKIEECPWLYNRKTVPTYIINSKFISELYTMTPMAREHLADELPEKEYVISLIKGYRNAHISLDQIKFALRGIEQGSPRKINEVKMSPARLKSFADSPLAKNTVVGFEAEIIVPNLEDVGKNEYVRDYSKDMPFPTGNDYYEVAFRWLSNGDNADSDIYIKRQLTSLGINYTHTIEASIYNYIETKTGHEKLIDILATLHGNDGSTEDTIEKDIKDENEWFEKAIKNLKIENSEILSFKDWLAIEHIVTMKDFCDEYNLSWPYYKSTNIDKLTIEELETDFVEYTGYTAKSSHEYHTAIRKPGVWIFEPDSSIESGSKTDGGIELISPPMPFTEAIVAIDNFWDWAENFGIYTNDSCGFHVGVSIPGKPVNDIDPIKLLLFLGDEYILRIFNRERNIYTLSMINIIRNRIRSYYRPYEIDRLLQKFKDELNKRVHHAVSDLFVQRDRYVTVNLNSEYIEFRSAGGDYLNNKDKIMNTIMRYIRAITIAADPTAYKEEYSKKLYKLVSVGNESPDAIYYFYKYATGQISKEILKDALYNMNIRKNLNKIF